MSAWTLPGYEIEEMVGFGASGEVWRARESATGQLVALKRLREDAPAGAADALHREASLLSSLDTPYVLRVREVIDDVLVLDYAGGGSLAALLSRRGTLEPGEVVTVAAPLASALAGAHARGFAHGDVSPANVLFTSDGMPLLADIGDVFRGTAEYVDPALVDGGRPDAASDVWALAALCHHLLCGMPPYEGQSIDEVLGAAVAGSRAPLGLLAPRVPRALIAAVEAGLCDDPSGRPTATAFGLALQQAQAAVPVRLSGAPPIAAPPPVLRETHALPRRPAEPEPPRARRSLPGLPAVAGVLLVLALLAGGLVWALGGGPPAPAALPPAPTSAPSPSAPASPAAGPGSAPTQPPSWVEIIDALDAAREQAFASGNADLLDEVYVPGSPPAQADALALAALSRSGRTASGVRHQFLAVTESAVSSDRATLRVVDVLGPLQVHDAQGALLLERPGRADAAHDVLLVRQADRWRIAELVRAPA